MCFQDGQRWTSKLAGMFPKKLGILENGLKLLLKLSLGRKLRGNFLKICLIQLVDLRFDMLDNDTKDCFFDIRVFFRKKSFESINIE